MSKPSPEAKQAVSDKMTNIHDYLEAIGAEPPPVDEKVLAEAKAKIIWVSTADVEKIAALVWQWRCEDRLTKQEIVNALDQARAPLVEALEQCRDWLRSQKRTPRMNQLIGLADAALIGTGEK